MNRRKFLKTGLGGALVLAGGGVAATRLWPGRSPAGPVREIRLNARIADWQVGPGASTRAWTYNAQVPGPEIRVREGERLRVVLTNEMPEPTTLHWHGLPVPYAMDGVPDLTQAPVQPGEQVTYEFTAGSPGTYWYHSHVGYQFDRGLYAPLIVEPHRESLSYDREYVLVFDDWLFDPEHPEPDRIYDLVLSGGVGSQPGAWMINGRQYPDTEPLEVRRGERVRLLLSNHSGMAHPMHLHGHFFDLVGPDGRPAAAPIRKDTLVIGHGQMHVVEFTADNPGARWLLHCHHLYHHHGGMATEVRYSPDPLLLDRSYAVGA